MNAKVVISFLGFLGSAFASVAYLPEPWDVVVAVALLIVGAYAAFRAKTPKTDSTTRSRVRAREQTIERAKLEKLIEVTSRRTTWRFRMITDREKIVGALEEEEEEPPEREPEPDRPNLGA